MMAAQIAPCAIRTYPLPGKKPRRRELRTPSSEKVPALSASFVAKTAYPTGARLLIGEFNLI
jgi:hypothetical protein